MGNRYGGEGILRLICTSRVSLFSILYILCQNQSQTVNCQVPSSNMASANVASVNSMYAELNKFCQNGDYDRAIKSANKGIKSL